MWNPRERQGAHLPLPTLLPGETYKLETYEEIGEYIPANPPSAIDQLMRLTKAKTKEQIGEFGPPKAAIALEREDDVEVSEELKLYEVPFGRDSLRVGMDLLPFYPKIMKATIMTLAELQGVSFDDASESEPGKIIHEGRKPDDPLAEKLTAERGWGWPYYGSVDATLMFISGIKMYAEQVPNGHLLLEETFTDRNGETRTIKDSLDNALAWADRKRAESDHGFIEYKSTIENGIENQVWRDSWDSYHHANGEIANHKHGIASSVVQQLAYDAYLDAAELYENVYGDSEKAQEYRDVAENLKTSIIEHFWIEDEEKGGYFALGYDHSDELDETGKYPVRQLKVRTSDMGHLLNSRLLEGEDMRYFVERTVFHLFSPEMLNASGIRTLAKDEVRYRPGAYHNGSVWLWDTALIADGLRRHGFKQLSRVLASRVQRVIDVTKKLPEFARGDDDPVPRLNSRIVEVVDENGKVNRVEQPTQEVQAWTVAAAIKLEYYNEFDIPDVVPSEWVEEYERWVINRYDLAA